MTFEYQREGVSFLLSHPKSYLADDPGLGKTRQALGAVSGRVMVVTPAAVRDARVWPHEAASIGWDGELDVVSYHELARRSDVAGYDAVLFDEAHRLKNRKVSWRKNAMRAAHAADRAHLLSGTPVPNQADELWGQATMIRDLPAYWKWAKEWFIVEATPFTAWSVTDRLRFCTDECEHRKCEHWAVFHRAVFGDAWLRRERDDVLRDLPPLTGAHDALETPMTPEQRKAYKGLKDEFLALVPEGQPIEAFTHSDRFVKMWQASTGLASIDPELDWRHSGKMKLLAEVLEGRSRPTLVLVWFRNTAKAVEGLVESLGLRMRAIGRTTTAKARQEAFVAFQGGDVDVMVGSISILKEGLTLTAADEVILLERSWVPSDNDQAIRRLHRIGQTRPVTVRQFVTPRSVDTGQWGKLDAKRNHIDKVLTARDL